MLKRCFYVNIAEKYKVDDITIVTSNYHLERCKEIFNFVYFIGFGFYCWNVEAHGGEATYGANNYVEFCVECDMKGS